MANELTLDFDKLKRDFNLSDEIIDACGFSREELQQIYADYSNKRKNVLEDYKNQFLSEFIISAKDVKFHSYSGRVKDAYHLVEKIIRKRHSKDSKYASMRTDDYYKYITDLIGCRILLVYKNDWLQVHEYLTRMFPNVAENYIADHDYASSYSETYVEPYMAEQPVAYIRSGDDENTYTSVQDVLINRRGYYRSVHYIIRYHEYYVEIQVRSLFEEAWGEVDHDILYPNHKDSKELIGFSTLLSRAAGMGDEMSAYFKNYAKSVIPATDNRLLDTPNLYGASCFADKEMSMQSHNGCTETDIVQSTPERVLMDILSK